MSADVVIIRGAPGVGKSQVAKALTGYFPGGAKVEVDVLRKMVISVAWKDQQEHINLLQVAAKVTLDFAELGFRPVIVVDTFSGDKVNRFIDTLLRAGGAITIRLIALTASVDELKRRLDARPADQFKEFEVSRKLNDDVLRIRPPNELQIDTSRLSPMQAAEEVYRQLCEP
jgi:broad-specificity NMP kinase